MSTRNKVIFINQSSELYGSDKTLLDLVVGLKYKYNIDPIVIMQNPGLLNIELDKHQIEYHFIPVIKLHKNMFTIPYMYHLAKHSILSVIKLRRLVKKNNVKVIYSNAFSVMLGNMYSLWFSTKHIWHCHEIILSPKVFLKVYNKIIKSNLVDEVIYNSKTTMTHWVKEDKTLIEKGNLVYNGIELNQQLETTENITKLRNELFSNINNQTLIFGNIGRISDRKGIEILIDSFNQIHQKNPNTRLLFVGSPAPGKEDFQEEMLAKINSYGINNVVKFVSFVHNVFPYWKAIDVAVIPSKEPESFGLVAIEAMLCQKPLIVSNHGGLAEIVEENVTGLKFTPDNLNDLVNSMQHFIHNPNDLKTFGQNGLERVKKNFDINKYVSDIASIIQNKLK